MNLRAAFKLSGHRPGRNHVTESYIFQCEDGIERPMKSSRCVKQDFCQSIRIVQGPGVTIQLHPYRRSAFRLRFTP